MIELLVITTIRLTLTLILSWSATSKARDIPHFVQTIARLRLLPTFAHELVASAVILSEYGLVVLLVFGLLPIIAFSGVVSMLCIFTVVLASSRLRQLDTGCGCFGKNDDTISWLDIIRNVLLILMSLTGLILATGSTRATTVTGYLVALPIAITITLFITQFKTVVTLLQHQHTQERKHHAGYTRY